MNCATLIHPFLAAALAAGAAAQDGTLDATLALTGGQWAGAYGEISDERVMWDTFTMTLEVDGERLAGTFFDRSGGQWPVAATQADGEARFTVATDRKELSFTGHIAGELLRGECKAGAETFSFVAMRESTTPDAELADCVGLYTRAGEQAIWIRKSLHLVLEDFERCAKRVLYARGGGEFVAGSMLALTDPIALRVTFERDASGKVVALTLVDEDSTRLRAAKSAPFREEPFELESAGVTIRGTLTLPPGDGPHPAVVNVHGSGEATRARAGMWPAFFASRGFAMLAVDKRGVGESEGTYALPGGGHDNLPHMKRRAKDVAAAVRALQARDDIDPDQIGLCGGSQAGWVIPLACADADVAFAITRSGGATQVSVEGVFSDYSDEAGADAASLSLDEVYRVTREFRPSDEDFRPRFAAMQCPGLWLYGLMDRRVVLVHGGDADAMGCRKRDLGLGRDRGRRARERHFLEHDEVHTRTGHRQSLRDSDGLAIHGDGRVRPEDQRQLPPQATRSPLGRDDQLVL